MIIMIMGNWVVIFFYSREEKRKATFQSALSPSLFWGFRISFHLYYCICRWAFGKKAKKKRWRRKKERSPDLPTHRYVFWFPESNYSRWDCVPNSQLRFSTRKNPSPRWSLKPLLLCLNHCLLFHLLIWFLSPSIFFVFIAFFVQIFLKSLIIPTLFLLLFHRLIFSSSLTLGSWEELAFPTYFPVSPSLNNVWSVSTVSTTLLLSCPWRSQFSRDKITGFSVLQPTHLQKTRCLTEISPPSRFCFAGKLIKW